ncbi:SMU1112c/YaeR family gloxylase I-like metalloprotein [Niabella hibiscisoli]|uniref:SMU1112c/YaeR family gloxylase I-like metalloprotein n=1 Tax=Niabella hibiscisoli TaxID=1825928 RepID=UPI001F0F1224|nr:VOC family protein [Niabella hibiscisoli]MCH5720404.1 VOC family protein [Niabella hibiscisoli]
MAVKNGPLKRDENTQKNYVLQFGADFLHYSMKIEKLHHIALICSDYEKSKQFYTDVLGFTIEQEVFRAERKSYKLDLSLNGQYLIELFSFPDPPARITKPEATGLRHIAFSVRDIAETINYLQSKNIVPEPVRVDEFTGKKFTFFADPDSLPIEVYEL